MIQFYTTALQAHPICNSYNSFPYPAPQHQTPSHSSPVPWPSLCFAGTSHIGPRTIGSSELMSILYSPRHHPKALHFASTIHSSRVPFHSSPVSRAQAHSTVPGSGPSLLPRPTILRYHPSSYTVGHSSPVPSYTHIIRL